MRAQRRAQVVRNGVRDVAHAFHQVFDAVEHAVDVAAQQAEFILAGDGNAPAQVACLDFPRRAADLPDARLELAPEQPRARHHQNSHAPATTSKMATPPP